MAIDGNNLPEFRSAQLQFADHIRNPELNPIPDGIEARRMKIYTDLFFNNIKSFLDSAFPVARSIVGEQSWLVLCREFVHRHGSESPYFLQISEEFLTFLHACGFDDFPPFLLELCHYEWVELSLDVSVEELDAATYDAQGDLEGEVVCSPLVRALTYAFPVQNIGVEHQPSEPPAQLTHLLVYRNSNMQVRFIESNPVTHRLLELIDGLPVLDALRQIRNELMQAGREVSEEQMFAQGLQTISHLHSLGIVAGSKIET